LETEVHFTATGMPSQRNQSDSFRFKCAAFYQSLKCKVGLVENHQIVRVSKREREGGRETDRERERGRGREGKRQRILP
jgi:hypothetical protein